MTDDRVTQQAAGLGGEGGRPCLCITCAGARGENRWFFDAAQTNHPHGFRYACELCGNKRCPHHTDHRLACTNSNAPGQQGSIY